MELVVKRFDELSNRELYELLRARVSVFVVEQECPYQELDGKDFDACHVFYRENGQILAYVRVIRPDGDDVFIGRVLTIRRGAGLGMRVMREGIRVAREALHARRIQIEAQSYAKGFYERLGFRQTSDEFLLDGIPHIDMILE